MATRRQFLDPIGAACRIALLKVKNLNTKVRITEHTVSLVSDNILERLFYRPFIYKDSREDVSTLYPVVVRFIELYLDMQQQSNNQHKLDDAIDNNDSEISKAETDTFGLGVFDENFGEFDNTSTENTASVNNAQEETRTKSISDKDYYNALTSLSKHIISGMEELQKTYDFDNSVFAIQYYISILRAGINGTYTTDMLPSHLRDVTTKTLLDNNKIKTIWKHKDIIHLSALFDKCFATTNDETEIDSYKAAIEATLDKMDNVFREMVNSTNSY